MKNIKVVTDKYGTEKWYNEKNELHREDGPAVIYKYKEDRKEWWINGKLHRVGAPAIIEKNKTEEWWVNGKLHRENGPAIISFNGNQIWYKNGEAHREGDEPALIVHYKSNEMKTIYRNLSWYKHGKLHRKNGPAIIFEDTSNGNIIEEEWWINGEKIKSFLVIKFHKQNIEVPKLVWVND